MECSHAVMHLPLNLLEGSADRSTIKFISDGSIIDFSNVNVLTVLVQLPRLITSLSYFN